jgi:hypothetical protein
LAGLVLPLVLAVGGLAVGITVATGGGGDGSTTTTTQTAEAGFATIQIELAEKGQGTANPERATCDRFALAG